MAVDPLRMALGTGASPAGPGGMAPAQAEGKAVGFLSIAMRALRMYVAVEPDHEDKLVAQQCLMNIQRLLAKDQKEASGNASSAVRTGPGTAPPAAGPPVPPGA
jgi:hypothetical protein